MRFAGFVSVLLSVTSCLRPTVVPSPPGAPVTIDIPRKLSQTNVALRLFVVGDGGEPGPRHDAVFGAVQRLAQETKVRALLLMPGDLTYPVGLPADCQASLTRLRQDYLSAVPDLPIIVVPGNHDHGDLDLGTNALIAGRDAYFDCDAQRAAASLEQWAPATCPCDPRWHDPVALGSVGKWPLLSGLTLITYDSQAALSRPEAVAAAVENVIDHEPAGQRLILMAHHPLESYGPHGYEHRSAQDVASAPYQAYVQRFSKLFRERASRILLLIFGHEHNLQYLPGSPPELISGAGSKTSPAGTPPRGVFGEGETSGFAVVDLLTDGGATVTLVWSGHPQVEHIAALPSP